MLVRRKQKRYGKRKRIADLKAIAMNPKNNDSLRYKAIAEINRMLGVEVKKGAIVAEPEPQKPPASPAAFELDRELLG